MRGKAISEFRSPNALPRAPTPLGTERVLRCCVCCFVDFCLYAAVLRVERWADLVPVFFDIYSDTLGRSDSGDSSVLIGIFCASLAFQDRTPSPLPSPVLFFSCRLEASARGRWHRAGLLRRRGDYYLGCGRRRYCGRVCCLSRRRVLALPQCF